MKHIKMVVLLVVLSVCVPGCWDATEINSLAIVGAIGIDLDSSGKPVVGMEVLNPAALVRGAAGSAPAGPDVVGWVMLESASTLTQAAGQISRRLPRTPYLGHTNIVIFGARYAAAGVSQFLDYFHRNDEFRRSIFISVCDTAVGLLQRPLMEDLASLTLNALTDATRYNSMTRPVTLNEFLRRLAEPGIEPIAMHTVGRPTHDIYVVREGTKAVSAIGQEEKVLKYPTTDDPREESPPPMEPEENVQGSGIKQPEQTVFIGLAVFKGDRAVGTLDGYEARGFLWVDGHMGKSYVEVPHPTVPEGVVSLHLAGPNTRIRPRLEGNQLSFEIDIKARFNIAETSHPLDLLNPETIRYLRFAAARAITEEATHTLKRVQNEFQTDIYGFGAEVHRRMPKYWQSVADQWDDIFPSLPVTIRAAADIRTGGMVIRN